MNLTGLFRRAVSGALAITTFSMAGVACAQGVPVAGPSIDGDIRTLQQLKARAELISATRAEMERPSGAKSSLDQETSQQLAEINVQLKVITAILMRLVPPHESSAEMRGITR
ncbi:hypothetical protein [Burkholderia gladioli]|uniref:hypothetical protein n=1 Tax=Burkholderia gladioli TaxID=28095 RepID=UPI00163DF185|nr:hypothetical protein [Burkholderia gladioli]MDN7465809.1 hypothetical protein [Burkholderia gladioli]